MENKAEHFQFFYSIYLFTWLCIITGIIFFTVGRIFLYETYGNADLIATYHHDLLESFKMGFLFDLNLMVILCSPFFVLAYLGFLLKSSQPLAFFFQCYKRIQIALLSTCLFIVIINHYYYGQFHSNLDLSVITTAVSQFKTLFHQLWHQFHVIRIALIITGFIVAIRFLVNRFYSITSKSYFSPYPGFQVIYLMIAFAFYALIFHGSLRHHPLEASHSTISNKTLINDATLNGLAALVHTTACTSQKI